jgi:NitT/TauT family transport system ATP-binding protein
MENEVLDLWQSKKKAVLFITHDLDEAIAMSDRVVVLSAGPGSHPIGEFNIDLERPRDVAEVRATPRFIELHQAIWAVLRDEVLKGYAQQLQVKAA